MSGALMGAISTPAPHAESLSDVFSENGRYNTFGHQADGCGNAVAGEQGIARTALECCYMLESDVNARPLLDHVLRAWSLAGLQRDVCSRQPAVHLLLGDLCWALQDVTKVDISGQHD